MWRIVATIVPLTGVGELGDSLPLLGVLVLAAVFSTFLFALSLVAYRQRQSRSYLLVTAAIGALVVRSAVGLATVYGLLPMVTHHIIEHALDVVIAILLLAAVYLGGENRRRIDDVDLDAIDRS